MADVKRRFYNSPLRAAQAARTRETIVNAARHLFQERGLTSVTIEEIATSCGISPQTVYATYGSKVGILIAILDALTAGAGIGALGRKLQAADGEPRRQLALYVHFDRRLFDAGRDIIGVAMGSRATDPEIEAWFAEGERRRRTNQASMVHGWQVAGALRPGLDERRAADILWAMSGPAVHRMLVVEAGWKSSGLERWLTEMLARELFGEARPIA